MKKWLQFTQERFDPATHFLMIALFFSAHLAALQGSGIVWSQGLLIALFVGTTAFFYKLRLYDEIKDFELDCVINPTRPLARGLVKHQDLYFGILACILIELICFSQSLASLLGISIAILYSLLMYKEFFIREKIRPFLTTYAVMHTIVSSFLSLALLSALTHQYPWQLEAEKWCFVMNSWFLFNIFEFGRKTFQSNEEREGVESYSKIFGRWGAVALVIVMGVVSLVLLSIAALQNLNAIGWGLGFSLGFMIVLGVLYAALNRNPWGKFYRLFSSLYIVLVYAIFVFVRFTA